MCKRNNYIGLEKDYKVFSVATCNKEKILFNLILQEWLGIGEEEYVHHP